MDVFVETERLLLRRFTDADLDDLVWLDSDPTVMQFLTGEPTPRAEIEHEVLPKILHDYQLSPAGRFAAIERSTAAFVGWAAIQPPQRGGAVEVELGYRFAAHAWGQGYATEAARALIRKGFTDLGTERVWAQTMAINLASRRVMAKAGLTQVRTFHPHFDDPLPGSEHGEVEYQLLRADWVGDLAEDAAHKARHSE